MSNQIPPESVTVETLRAFCAAWNRHDIDGLMFFMSDDCEFLSSAGPNVCGTRFTGREAVREGYAQALAAMPDAQWTRGRPFVFGDRVRLPNRRRLLPEAPSDDGSHVDD